MGLFDFLSAGAAGVSDPEVTASFAPKKRGIFGLSDGFANTLNDIGDALLTANGEEPIHRKRRDAAAIAEALPMLDDPSTAQEALKRIFGLDPKVGADVQKNYYAREKTLLDQQAEAAKAQAEFGAKTREQALNQLNAGVPRDIVLSAASKKGIDVSDLPDDPKIISSMVRGGMAPKDYYQTVDREDDNDRAERTLTANVRLAGGRLKQQGIANDRITDHRNRTAATGEKNATTNANRVSKGRGNTSSASSGGGMIRKNKTTGVIEYRQPDGTYKPK